MALNKDVNLEKILKLLDGMSRDYTRRLLEIAQKKLNESSLFNFSDYCDKDN